MREFTVDTKLDVTTVRECCRLVFVPNAKKPIHSFQPATLCKDIKVKYNNSQRVLLINICTKYEGERNLRN